MGTDITINVERYQPDEGWRYIGWEQDILEGDILKRNYYLYCILANEEGDYQWVDAETTRGLIPVVPARGVPKDADPSQEYSGLKLEKDPYNRWYPSWVTLQEILDYPHWDKYKLVEGERRSLQDYKERFWGKANHEVLKVEKLPTGEVLGGADLEQLIASFDTIDPGRYVITINGKERYRDLCKKFLEGFVPKLARLADDPSHLRLIYDFW